MKNNLKKSPKKIIPSLFVFIIIFNLFFSINLNKTYAANEMDQSFQNIENLSNGKTGILTCDPSADQYSEEACNPKDAILLGVKLFQFVIYLLIFALVFFSLYYAVGVVYNSDNPGYLKDKKKKLRKILVALGYAVFSIAVVFGILKTFGMDSKILDFVKGLFVNNNFDLIPHTYAQSIESITEKSTNGEYTNFFPGLKFIPTVLTAIKLFISYLVAPALIGGAIWAGVRFVAAQGNPEKLKRAKKFALYVAIGIAFSAAIYPIASMILNSLNDVAKQTGVKTTIDTKLTGLKSGEACLGGATEDSKKCSDGLTCKDDSGVAVANEKSGTCK